MSCKFCKWKSLWFCGSEKQTPSCWAILIQQAHILGQTPAINRRPLPQSCGRFIQKYSKSKWKLHEMVDLQQNVNRPAPVIKRVSDAYIRLTHKCIYSFQKGVEPKWSVCNTKHEPNHLADMTWAFCWLVFLSSKHLGCFSPIKLFF